MTALTTAQPHCEVETRGATEACATDAQLCENGEATAAEQADDTDQNKATVVIPNGGEICAVQNSAV